MYIKVINIESLTLLINCSDDDDPISIIEFLEKKKNLFLKAIFMCNIWQ